MSDKGLFGGLFDFNGDGHLDTFEKAAEFGAFMCHACLYASPNYSGGICGKLHD